MSGEPCAPRRLLVCRAGTCLFGFALESLLEITPPLSVTALRAAPSYVTGVSLVRGAATPVVDLRRVLGLPDAAPPQRWVVVKAGARRVALEVESVLGFREVDSASLQHMPPLLAQAATGVLSEIASLDAELLVVLEATRILPASVWRELEPPAST